VPAASVPALGGEAEQLLPRPPAELATRDAPALDDNPEAAPAASRRKRKRRSLKKKDAVEATDADAVEATDVDAAEADKTAENASGDEGEPKKQRRRRKRGRSRSQSRAGASGSAPSSSESDSEESSAGSGHDSDSIDPSELVRKHKHWTRPATVRVFLGQFMPVYDGYAGGKHAFAAFVAERFYATFPLANGPLGWTPRAKRVRASVRPVLPRSDSALRYVPANRRLVQQ
jgi:hypothetical protein